MADNKFRVEDGLHVDGEANVVGNTYFTANSYWGANSVVITNDNRVSIGRASGPAAGKALHVDGEVRFSNTLFVEQDLNVSGNLTFTGTSAGDVVPGITDTYSLGNNTLRWKASLTNTSIVLLTSETFQVGNSTVVFLHTTNGGNTGIRNASPDATLAVTGTMNVSSTFTAGGLTTLVGNTTFSGASHAWSGNVAFDGTTLIVDASNNRVGIKVQPTADLHLVGTYLQTGGTHSITGNTTIAGNTDITGNNTVLRANSTVTALAIVANSTVTNTNIGGTTLYVGTTNTVFAGPVAGITTLASGNTTHTGFANVTTTLQVGGTSTLTGNVTMSGTLQTISGNVSIDSGVLFVDASANRVGVNRTDPGHALDVIGVGNFSANVQADRLVSVVSTGTAPLVVASTTKVTNLNADLLDDMTTASVNTASTVVSRNSIGGAAFSDLQVTRDLVVSGNLTISGTTTTINTTDLNVADNQITLNSDWGNTAPTENQGIIFVRGTGVTPVAANVSLTWDETNDKFAFAGNTEIVGFANVSGNFVQNNGSFVVGANTTVTLNSNTTIAGTLLVVNRAGPASTQQHSYPAVANDTIALLAATQTFTAKTLTNPIINAAGPSSTQQHTFPALANSTVAVLAAVQTFTQNTTFSGTFVVAPRVGPSATALHDLPNVANSTVAVLAATQTFTQNTTFSGTFVQAPRIGASSTQLHDLPALANSTIAVLVGAQTLSNKTLASPVLSGTVSGSVTLSGDLIHSGNNSFTGTTVVAPRIGPSVTQQHTLPAVANSTVAVLAAVQTFTQNTSFSGTFVVAPNIGPSATQVHTLPAVANSTVAVLAATQTFTQNTTFSGTFVQAPRIGASSTTLHDLPALANSTLVVLAGAQTLTSKTLTNPIINAAGPSSTQQHSFPAIANSTVAVLGAVQTFSQNTTFTGTLHVVPRLGPSATQQHELPAVANSTIALANGTIVTNLNADLLDGQHGSYYDVRGKHAPWIDAGAMISRLTAGATYTQVEATTNKTNWAAYDFDPSTNNHVQFRTGSPRSWNKGTVTFRAVVKNGAVGSSSANVALFGLRGRWFDAGSFDQALGTAQEVTFNVSHTTADEIKTTANSAAITIDGTPGNDGTILWELYRNASAVGDNYAANVSLIGIYIDFTTNAANDN